MRREFTFGNDENGSAIAAETAKADPITTTSGICIDTPILAMTGINMIDATVCDTKVDMDAQKSRI